METELYKINNVFDTRTILYFLNQYKSFTILSEIVNIAKIDLSSQQKIARGTLSGTTNNKSANNTTPITEVPVSSCWPVFG